MDGLEGVDFFCWSRFALGLRVVDEGAGFRPLRDGDAPGVPCTFLAPLFGVPEAGRLLETARGRGECPPGDLAAGPDFVLVSSTGEAAGECPDVALFGILLLLLLIAVRGGADGSVPVEDRLLRNGVDWVRFRRLCERVGGW